MYPTGVASIPYEIATASLSPASPTLHWRAGRRCFGSGVIPLGKPETCAELCANLIRGMSGYGMTILAPTIA